MPAAARRADPVRKAVDPGLIVSILTDLENLLPAAAGPAVLADVVALLVAVAALCVGLGAFSNTTAQALVAIIPTAVALAWRVVATVRAGHKARVAAAVIQAHAGK